MNRNKFKQALNELDSPQRTALLYLEKLIIETRKSTPAPQSTIDQNKLNEITKKIKTQDNKINGLGSKVNQYRITNKDVLHNAIKLSSLLEAYNKEIDYLIFLTNSVSQTQSDILKHPGFEKIQVFKSRKDAEKHFNVLDKLSVLRKNRRNAQEELRE